MKDKLRELLGELMSACEMIGYATSGNERASHRLTRDQVKTELLAILDAEGDGGAVAWQSKRRPEDYPDEWKDCTKDAFDIINRTKDSPWITRELFDHPARSGVVSDEDVEAACIASLTQYDDGTTEWDEYTDKEKGYVMNRMRRALEHFARRTP